ncbi:hypothetical protein [Prosthecobacter sp.]|uniref:hypothetical protein n=1 Tax=Prosthecobacter sp. TaxID=1965333 RepID=UPI002487D993|nr:hypothetical protein [Prosthecobacter sp.]MDI1310879.1 hypothetical protein [Prosthecobacter sp.]
MNINLLKKGVLTENAQGIGEVSRKMLRERAVELAVIDGRSGQDASKSDWEQAKRELTGEPEMDPQEALLESAPESERWDPLPGSSGHRAAVITSDDEDSEGRSDAEALVDEGVREAEHDQMLQAARASEEKDDQDQ